MNCDSVASGRRAGSPAVKAEFWIDRAAIRDGHITKDDRPATGMWERLSYVFVDSRRISSWALGPRDVSSWDPFCPRFFLSFFSGSGSPIAHCRSNAFDESLCSFGFLGAEAVEID
jgi:hypothetical protein